MRVVGLTGGIGSGKSTVARLFADLGATIIDADQLAREVVEPGTPGLRAIVDRFGPEVLDPLGRLDRRKLGALVFSDAEARRALNEIVHPAVAARALERFTTLTQQGAPLILYDVPLFFENALDRTIPESIVVWASPETQRRRIAARDGLAPEEIEARLASQLSLDEKIKRATWVIDNDGSLEDTREAVRALHERLSTPESNRH